MRQTEVEFATPPSDKRVPQAAGARSAIQDQGRRDPVGDFDARRIPTPARGLGPGVGIEPRTPQKVTRISADPLSIGASETHR